MSEYNLCGVLVHAQKGKQEQVKQLLTSQPGIEIHAITEDGRLVITLEDESRKQVAERIMKLHELEGVLSAAMIYQFSDDIEAEELVEINNTELTSEERMSA